MYMMIKDVYRTLNCCFFLLPKNREINNNEGCSVKELSRKPKRQQNFAFEDGCNTFTYSFQQDHHENIVKMIDYE